MALLDQVCKLKLQRSTRQPADSWGNDKMILLRQGSTSIVGATLLLQVLHSQQRILEEGAEVLGRQLGRAFCPLD